MVSCTVCSCTKSIRIKKLGITFHRFPKDVKRRKMWIKFVNQKSWEPKANSYICSQHFTSDSFDKTSKVKVLLYPEAIPTVHRDVQGTFVYKKDREESSNDEEEDDTESLKDHSSSLFDFDAPIKNEKSQDCDPLSEINNAGQATNQSSNADKLRRDLTKSRRECEELRKKLKSCEKSTAVYIKKIDKLKTIVRFLRESNKYVMSMKKKEHSQKNKTTDFRNNVNIKIENVLITDFEEEI